MEDEESRKIAKHNRKWQEGGLMLQQLLQESTLMGTTSGFQKLTDAISMALLEPIGRGETNAKPLYIWVSKHRITTPGNERRAISSARSVNVQQSPKNA